MESNTLELNLAHANAAFLQALDAFSEEDIFRITSQGKWNAAMIAEHLVLSATAIARWISGPGKATGRDPQKHVTELESLFLDFSTKFQAPGFIEPTGKFKTKDETVQAFRHAATRIESLFHAHALDDICTAIDETPLMGSTRIELFTFVMVHTKRHTHQLANLYAETISTRNARRSV